MSKRKEKPQTTGHRDDDPESAHLSAITDIARQIAVLVVRQHRRLKTKEMHDK